MSIVKREAIVKKLESRMRQGDKPKNESTVKTPTTRIPSTRTPITRQLLL